MPGAGRAASVSSPEGDDAGRLALSGAWRFRRVLRSGRKFRGSDLRASYRKNSLGMIRLGFSLSAKCGSAVHRNRFRRRLRSLAMENRYRVGADVVVFPVGRVEESTWEGLRSDFLGLLERMENELR